MATVLTICTDALRILNVAPVGQSAQHEDAVEALNCLNDMMHAISVKDGVIEWSDKTFTDEMPTERGLDDLVKHALAARLMPRMGRSDLDPMTYQTLMKAETQLEDYFKPQDYEGAEYF